MTASKQLTEVRVDASLQCAAHDETSATVLAGSAAGTVALTIPLASAVTDEERSGVHAGDQQ